MNNFRFFIFRLRNKRRYDILNLHGRFLLEFIEIPIIKNELQMIFDLYLGFHCVIRIEGVAHDSNDHIQKMDLKEERGHIEKSG